MTASSRTVITTGRSTDPAPGDLEEYSTWLRSRGLSRNTAAQRVAFARYRLEAWGTFDVPPAEVADFLDEYFGWTHRTYRAHLRSIYLWQVETGRLEASPVEGLRARRSPRPQANPLTDEQATRVLEMATGDLRAWLMLGLLAGLRSHEIAKIRGVDITETSIRVDGKGGYQANIPTHPELWALAQRFPRDDSWWFPSIQERCEYVSEGLVGLRVREHFRQLGITQGSIHRCRHTYATQLVRHGVPLHLVQVLMRHASLQTTQAYVAVSSDELARSIRLLGSSSSALVTS